MNRPVQVMLDTGQQQRARRRAAEAGLTLSEYIARLVREDLESWTPEADASAVIAVADTPTSDVPPHAGMYIGEAVAARLSRTDRPGQ